MLGLKVKGERLKAKCERSSTLQCVSVLTLDSWLLILKSSVLTLDSWFLTLKVSNLKSQISNLSSAA